MAPTSQIRLAAALGVLCPAICRAGARLDGVSWVSHEDAGHVGVTQDPLAPVTIDVGDAKVHFITQGGVTAKADWMFPFLAGDTENLAAFPNGNVSLSYGVVLVQVGGKNILLDTSVDADHTGAFGGPWTTVRPYESLQNGFDALTPGISRDDIDGVVVSHMHRDHTGWAIEEGGPYFANARYYFQSAEVAYWNATNPARVVWDDNIQPLFDAGLVTEVDGDGEADALAPGLQIFAWAGHTPGHQVVRIQSGETVAFYVGDAIHVEQQLARPDWGPFFDWAPKMAASQRRSLLQMIADEKALLLSPHLPFPGWGYIQADTNGGFTYSQTEPGTETAGRSLWETVQPYALVALGVLFGLLCGHMCLGQGGAQGEKGVEMGFMKGMMGVALKYGGNLPGVKGAIDAQINAELAKIDQKMHGEGDPTAVVTIPAQGRLAKDVIALADERVALQNAGTNIWGGIYHGPGELSKLQSEMWTKFNETNTLYPNVFTAVRKFEAEIISMVVGIVHGHEPQAEMNALTNGGASAEQVPMKDWNCKGQVVGVLSSGGTESILIAVLAYRSLAYERGIEKPEIVGCFTAHPAIDKACHYFGVKLIKVQAEKETQQLRAAAVAAAMTPRTIAIYASAPTFPHGVVDPIPELAALARQRDVGLHVDNCLGGFYLSFLQRSGVFPGAFDFQVPGVTTMSVDVHKYGFASKGVSVVAFRNNALRHHSFHSITDGPTLYVTPTLQGSRGGAHMAAAWATLLNMGMEGYERACKRLNDVFVEVCDVVKATDGVKLLCVAHCAVIPIVSDDPKLNIYTIASEMGKRRWNMFTSQNPAAMAFCVGEQHHGGLIPDWTKALRDSIAFIRANPNTKPEGDAGTYATAEMFPVEILETVTKGYLDVKLSVKPAGGKQA